MPALTIGSIANAIPASIFGTLYEADFGPRALREVCDLCEAHVGPDPVAIFLETPEATVTLHPEFQVDGLILRQRMAKAFPFGEIRVL